MYIIVAGGGTTGAELIKKLSSRKEEVVVIDKDKEVCDEIYASYSVETIHGNATRISVLRAAGISKADVVVATMGTDADNLALSVLAKSFAVPETIALMKKKSYLEAYKTVGVTKILNVVDSLVSDIVYQIEKPDVKRVALLGEGAVELFIIRIPEKGKIVGKAISEIASSRRFSEETIIAGIYNEENNEFKVPHGNTKIDGGVLLFIITRPEQIKRVVKYLTKK
jgi:trk system potassium uptake protein TrkA